LLRLTESRYAYRRFGKRGTVPLLFLGYFNSNMDAWDPEVTNSLAADHEVILFDNAGVGASGGTPDTVAEMTQHCVAFCRALGLKAIIVVGFSLGGMIGQQLALEHPDLVQALVLLGTGPRGGEGMTFTELSPEEQEDPVAFLLGAFFSPSEASQAAGREYMKRLDSRKKDRDLPVSRDSAVAQLAAIREWGTIPAAGRYATLKNVTHTTLIVHGNKDTVVAPINALILAEHLPNAHLVVYSDSSHGAQYQHARLFLEHVKLFLSEGDSTAPETINPQRITSFVMTNSRSLIKPQIRKVDGLSIRYAESEQRDVSANTAEPLAGKPVHI
jgi:pimeloyl-ACP methyl ester carboxylesterase